MCCAAFASLSYEFGQVGHTHNLQDQRFSIINRELGKAQILENPDDCLDCIRAAIPPTTAEGGHLYCEHVMGLWDWQRFLEPLALSASGVAIKHHGEAVNHSFRIVSRSELRCLKVHDKEYEWPVDVCEELESVDAQPQDAVLLCKQFMASSSLSQMPQLLLPAMSLSLITAELAPLPKKTLSEVQCREFRKTARVMGGEPWFLYRASAYLRMLIEDNVSNPVPLNMVLTYSRAGAGLLPHDFPEMHTYCPGTPKLVTVRGKKRPAAEVGQVPQLNPMPKCVPKRAPKRTPKVVIPPCIQTT